MYSLSLCLEDGFILVFHSASFITQGVSTIHNKILNVSEKFHKNESKHCFFINCLPFKLLFW